MVKRHGRTGGAEDLSGLPIEAVLGDLQARLRSAPNAVLVAPPGAGKTTRVPLALLDEPWALGGKLILLEPRRLAARGAAARMASTLGERVGETVGHRIRADVKVSLATRIEVVTEGVFTRMILADPSLEGVSGVIFDEFHERSLDADLGLAFALEAQALLRPDLRLLIMSATLDGAAVSRLMDHAPVVESEGRAFPVETRHRPRDAARRLDDDVARLVREALADEPGDVLVFLPGQAEIRRTVERLAETIRSPFVDVRPLYGALTPAEQDTAIAPSPPGRRKVVLATNVAQTSLTIEGVRVVIDAGLSRGPRFDPGTGLTRLVTVKVSRAAADQRRGRAGRTQPGVCYRLWDAAEERGLPAFDRPEIADSDLSGVALALAQWGAREPAALPLLDPPPAAAFAAAVKGLQRMGALSADRALTPHGAKLAHIGVAPRLAHMIVLGAALGLAGRAARLAAVLSEPGLGGTGVDLSTRVERLARDAGGRGREALSLAGRWAKAAGGSAQDGATSAQADGRLIAAAFPDRIAKARGGDGGFLLANGRGARLDPTDALCRSPWLAVAELAGGAAQDRIVLAAALTEAEVREIAGADLATEETVEIDAAGRLSARRRLRLGRIVVEDRVLDRPSREAVARALAGRIRAQGLAALPWSAAARSLRDRVAFMCALDPDAGWPDVSEAALLTDLDVWLGDALATAGGLDRLGPSAVEQALRDHLGWGVLQRLDREAPTRFTTPAGGSAEIDYGAEGGPRVEARVQELFGLARHPTTANGRVPLTLALLSPARRPVQTTKDLPGFWAGSWKAVRTEMRGRYPRHPWPEDPLAAPPTTRAKPRGT